MTLRVYRVGADGSREEYPSFLSKDRRLPTPSSSLSGLWPACRCPARETTG